ncbi:MAG: M23 family metallopeptidase [Candidatus Woesebacteria bacterium]|jgi:murein DD-endopeptidase MepM/ murein hydrolase activator NlpD
MISLSINLPKKRRLDLHLVKRRKTDSDSLLPNLGKIRRVKKGNKISRFFRHIFEHKNIKKILGANLATIVLATSLLPKGNDLADINSANISARDSVVLTTQSSVQYPVEDPKVNQYYSFFHPGYDFEGVVGDPVYPVMPGIVEAVGYSRVGYGNAIYINHNSNLSSLYAHLSKIEVEEGEKITNETKIGEVGTTGRASGDHLHLEIHYNNAPINPSSILP